jgi:hypothetical protein
MGILIGKQFHLRLDADLRYKLGGCHGILLDRRRESGEGGSYSLNRFLNDCLRSWLEETDVGLELGAAYWDLKREALVRKQESVEDEEDEW